MITQTKFDKDAHLNNMVDGILKKNPEAKILMLQTEHGWEISNIEPADQRFTTKFKSWLKAIKNRSAPTERFINKASY